MKLLQPTSYLAILAVGLGVMLGSPALGLAQGALAGPPAQVPQQDALPFSAKSDINVTLHADWTAQIVESVRITVLTASAVQSQGQQQFSYIDGMQSLDIDEAYTEKPDGTRIQVEPANILTRDAASGLAAVFRRDEKVKTVIFPGVAIGDTLVTTTRREIKSSLFPGQFTQTLWYRRELPMTPSTVRIVAPKDLMLHVALYGEGLEHQIVDGDTTTSHIISYRPQRWLIAEAGETSPIDRDPRVIISTFKNYEEFGRSFWALAGEKTLVTPEIQRLADEITRGIDDRHAQAEAIDRWLKLNIRYVAVFLGTGRWVPNDAAMVLKNKYGDCKDHATLMMALLAAKHIASEYVLINAGTTYTLPEPAVTDFFNHVIVYLPEFETYDDPTNRLASFGVLGFQAYDKPVLHASASGARLGRTPAMQPGDHVSTNRTHLEIAADGVVKGETWQITTGAFATAARTSALQSQAVGAEVTAQRWLQSAGNPGTGRLEIGSPLDLKDPYEIGGKFVLNARTPVPAIPSWPIPRGMPAQKKPGDFILGARAPGRQMPFVCYAGHQIDEIDITMAEGLPMPQAPKGRNLEKPLFTCQTSYRIDGRTLKVRREFVSRVPGQVCAPELETEIAGSLKVVSDNIAFTKLVFPAYTDEAGHAFQYEAGHLFRSEAGHRTDLMAATLDEAHAGRMGRSFAWFRGSSVVVDRG